MSIMSSLMSNNIIGEQREMDQSRYIKDMRMARDLEAANKTDLNRMTAGVARNTNDARAIAAARNSVKTEKANQYDENGQLKEPTAQQMAISLVEADRAAAQAAGEARGTVVEGSGILNQKV